MKSDVKKYVEQCEICQRNKTEATSPSGLLQLLPILELRLEDWTMKFVKGLPKARGFDSIMVVVDRLGKEAQHFTPKQTAKRRESTAVRKLTSTVSTTNNRQGGTSIFLGLGYGITPPSTLRRKQARFKVYSEDPISTALKENLTMVQNRTKKQVDLHRREMKFEMGDEVFLKPRPYWQKLAPKFYGHCIVPETIGEVAYKC
ncbi:ty3-gypsy retrotransposon protein [Cucumis melo var. makuwa]|nr:ty3-gypsy retrotransposon protein [Cucumis melo var. makuwa]